MNSTDSRDWGQGGEAGPGRLLRAGPARALSFTAAALFCLVIVLYPQLLVRHGGPPNHGALVLGFGGPEQVAEKNRVYRRAFAERDPAHCHRSYLADYLVAVRGVEVIHIRDATETTAHVRSPLARVDGSRLVYDLGQRELF